MNPIISLARQSIEQYLKDGGILKIPSDLPKKLLKDRAGVFVSVHTKKGDKLCGCIGTYLPTKKNIAEEVICNAIACVSRDPRFKPVTKNQFKNLKVKVDILSEPEPIQSARSLDPKIYGVVVRSQKNPQKCGILLPDLPEITDPNYQLAIAMQKGGITPDEPIYLYRFTVERFEE